MSTTGISVVAASQHIKEGEYWLNKLSGELVKSSFPYDHKKIGTNKDIYNSVQFDFSGDIYTKLTKLSNGSDSRLFMILVTGLVVLLDRYTGNGDIIIGAPIFKQDVEAEFINTVIALRTEIKRESTFKELLLQVKDTIFEATENQNYPIDTLLYQLGMEEEETDFPLFDVAVFLENVHDRDYLGSITTNMVISFDNNGKSLEGSIEYNGALYEQSTIQRIIAYLKNLFINALFDVNLKLGDIGIMQEDERRKLLFDFNNSSKPYPKDKTIHRLFEEQVELTPDGIAVQYGDEQLTYRQLNEKANRLARVLREKGIGSSNENVVVAIMVERSLEMVVGMMGVLKAGGAYLPMDPEYPGERKQFMLKDSGTRLLLVKGPLEEGIEFEGTVIDLDREDLFSNDGSNLEVKNEENSLAYIIYTSGSTGQPKGVLIEHQSIVNTLTWRKDYYQFDHKDVVLQIPSFSFDSSVEDIFTPIISGSKLVIIDQQNRFNIVYLEDLIAKHRITHFLITPGLYKTFLDQSPECLKSLRIVTVAGDSFTEEFVKEHFNKLGNVRLINEYGPTENSVCTTVYEFTPKNTRVLIGNPINNVKCYILDKYGSLCPVGIPGELCAAGVGIARGYLNRPELTAEKFVPNKFADEEDSDNCQILYRTGDLARWLPDGNIEFLGRIDHQVKIRGFRIELGEIESQLLTHEQVKETIVIARENPDGSKYLVQYFVANEKLTIPELRWCLADALPEYMIPSFFVQLEKMPLTPNGKIDRRALPEPADSNCSAAEYEEPSGEIEIQLVEIWKEVLNLERIGVNDNFFEIGGHSLRATTLVSQIRKKFYVDVPLREIFKKPTVRQLAKYIENGAKSTNVSIEPVREKEFYPASAAQKRMYLVNKVEGTGVTYNVPMEMIVDGRLDRERTQKAFDAIVKRHEAFRTYFGFMDDELVQRIEKDVDFKIEYMEAQESELEDIREKFVRPFDFKAAPLLRVLLVHLREGKSVILFDMHHIISDGVSMDVLIKEFVAVYEGRELPGLRIQYKDYTAWQEEYLKSSTMKEQKEFWKDEFSGELPVLNMPTDYPRPSVQSFEGAKIRTMIDADTTGALKGLANKTGTTLFTVLLGAYNVLLSKYTGQEDIIVGSPIAGRNNPDLENIIGMFINLIALRNYPENGKSFRDFLKEVGESSLRAFENQDYQFNDLVDSLNFNRNLSRNPLFDTMFALQNMEFRQSDIDGMGLSLKDLETKTSKFDITLIAVERNNEIELIFEFCTKLYKKETMERLSAHFLTILKGITENPDGKLYEIPMLADDERKQLLVDFNNTKVEYDMTSTICQVFEAQVDKTPNKIVAVFRGNSITYSELNKKANQLANTLRSKGVKSDDIVGIMAERSLEMIVGIIGILKAGGAYLPIDPEYPGERIKYLLDDSKTGILLTHRHLMDKAGFNGIILDLEDQACYSGNGENTVVVSKSSDLAYVIYTSGSTGKPKGVMIEHKSLINLCRWHIKYYGITADDRCTKYAGFGFDASVWEIFPYIICGATIHIIEDSIKLDMIKLNQYYQENDITISFLPTQICEQFMDLNNTSLRKLLTGGDKLNQFTARSYELVNNYGPTENTVVATSFAVDGRYSNIPIGKPIYNTQIYILDKHNNLQPVGVPGELCIAGDSLARGYLNKPELTAEKFVPNPFYTGEQLQEKGNSLPANLQMESKCPLMYKTGDLARWLPDGNIEFLGRVDHQVKIRGNRIELGEIEAQLLRQGDIREAVVVAREDKGENKYLCAYIVSDRDLTVQDIREFLSIELPDYMIPAYFVQLDKLPLTPNGKLDKKALPEPDGSVGTGVEYTAPGNETEEKLVDIWKEVLGIEKIGTNDNFFDLGGNSLLMMKVISKICSSFNVSEEKITVMTMFTYPTIKLMANQLDGEDGIEGDSFEDISTRIKKRNEASARRALSRGMKNEQ